MPTTTNFGWTTPADTDLVKDGAAAIRTLAGNIDTSLVDLKGGTTGQYLQKNSNTDLDYVWATVNVPVSKVVQIVTATTSTDTASSSITFADTTLTATITPTSASNKVLVFVNQNGLQKTNGDSQNAIDINLLRGATNIASFAQSVGYTNTALQLWTATASISYLDTPATTSATTYKTQFRNPNNSAQISVQKAGTVSSIVLMEVTP